MASRRDLLLEICSCPNVKAARASDGHPCAEVVRSQEVATLNSFQAPAPWVGQIHRAPILFIGSNPSISHTEHHPTWRKSGDFKIDYFERHFGGGGQAWTQDGVRTLQTDGTYSNVVRFYSGARQHAAELLEREPEPGVDYAVTWVVRCKSTGEIGVGRTARECSTRYLRRTIQASSARLIVVLGKHARDGIADLFGILTGDAHVAGPVKVGRRERWFVSLPHPSARQRRDFRSRCSPEELEHLRGLVKSARRAPPAG